MRLPSRHAGLTLIELLVVIALLSLLQSLAVPAFADLASSMRLTAAVNTLVSSLTLARSEAIKRNARTVVCKSSDGVTCTRIGGWEQGWLVFHDPNNNAALDSGETVVLRVAALSNDVRLTGNDPLVHYVSFTPLGKPQYMSGAFQAGRLTVCPRSDRPVPARQIVISSSGRLRTLRTQVDSCP